LFLRGGFLRRHGLSIFCLAVLVSLPGFGAGTPLGGLKVCLLPLADLTPAGNVSEYTGIISDDLRLGLEQAGVSLVPPDRVREIVAKGSTLPADLLEPRAAVAAASSAGGDVALGGYIALRDDALQVSLRAYDVSTGILVAGLLRSYAFDISLYSRLWQDVLEMLSRSVEVPGSAARSAAADAATSAGTSGSVASAGQAVLTLTSRQEGMEVALPGGRNLGRIVNGRLTLSAEGGELPSPLILEKRLNGYHDDRQAVKGSGEIALTPLAPVSRFAVEADWTLGQLLGLGSALRLYVVPDAVFVAPSVYVSGQPPVGPGGNTAFHVDTGMQLGVYLFFPPESLFRFGVSSGAGAIFSWVQSTSLPVFFDPYVDFVSLWIETNLPWFSLTLRSDLKYSLGGQAPNLLGEGLVLWAGFLPPICLGVLFRW
jgi:hypothetical protein